MSAGQKFSYKYEKAVIALLQENSIQSAATVAKIGEATLRRWIKREDFQLAYQDARRKSFETSLYRLQILSSNAVNALRRNLDCGKPGIETRAADIVLTHAREAGCYLDLAERLTVLEHRLKKEEAT